MPRLGDFLTGGREEQALLAALGPQGQAALERYQRRCNELSSLLDRDSFI